jgi:DNA-binding GntR family transcriptional regulator
MPKYAYEEVADVIRDRIYDGTYPPGSQLPSRTDLGKEFQCSGQVIGWAMRILRDKSLIQTLHGVGVLVVNPLPPRGEES